MEMERQKEQISVDTTWRILYLNSASTVYFSETVKDATRNECRR